MDPLTRLVHVTALVVYGGTTLALVTMLLPTAAAAASPAEERRVLGRGLTAYNVISVGALGVLIMSGATALTGLKASFGAGYSALLWPLVGKLGLTFALTMVGTYLSFGIAHRLVRAERLGDPVDAARQRSMLARLRGGAWLALALTLWTTWAGLQLSGRAVRPAPAAPYAATP
jgi:uncharacterized membrane protein